MVRYGAKQADESIGKMGYAMHCFKCLHREAVRKTFQVERSARCSECGSELSLAGPLWLGKIADRGFCELMENGAKKRTLRLGGKILKTLSLIKEESDTPFSYYVIDELSSLLRLPVPPVRRVLQKLKDEGFEACLTHFDSRGIKSNAPAMKMQEILRETASEIDKS
jgi:tRNA (guanine26-N2/guanine27-N2)-dimethyltransferase